MLRRLGTRTLAAAITGACAVLGFTGFALSQASADSPTPTCSVTYTTRFAWGTGFAADIVLHNLGPAWKSWTLTYTYTGGQKLIGGWNGQWSQSGPTVKAVNAWYNGAVATGHTVEIGAAFTGTSTAAIPGGFTVNGASCAQGNTTPPGGGSSAPGTPSGGTPTPPGGGTTPPSGGGEHVANPFVGATPYLNPDYTAEVNSSASKATGDLAAKERSVANNPTGVWMDSIAALTGTAGHRGLQAHLDAALAQQKGNQPVVLDLVVYDLPGRDCAALASNGELPATPAGLTTYETRYIDPMVALLSNPKYRSIRIAAIIEPDSLPNAVTNQSKPACATATPLYEQGVQYALNKLHPLSNVYTYLDIAHSAWLGWSSNMGPAAQLFAQVIRGTTAGFDSVDGFISDTANYTPTQEPFLTNANQQVGGQPVDSATFYQYNPYFDEYTYDNAMYSALVSAGFPARIGFLIDTSRNGWGGPDRPTALNSSPTDVNSYVAANKVDKRPFRGDWCNQAGAGLGARPQALPYGASSHIIGFVWIKPPGESDGDYPTATHSHGDPHCDPAGTNTDGNGATYPTGSMPGPVPAGQWFPAQFQQLVQNAYPALP